MAEIINWLTMNSMIGLVTSNSIIMIVQLVSDWFDQNIEKKVFSSLHYDIGNVF